MFIFGIVSSRHSYLNSEVNLLRNYNDELLFEPLFESEKQIVLYHWDLFNYY